MLLLLACSENALIAKDGEPATTFDTSAPDIEVDPLTVDFGEVLPGASAAATVTIRNVGDGSLALDSLSLRADSPALSFTTPGSPLIAPGSAVETVVTWTPTESGNLTEFLDVPSNDPDEPVVSVSFEGGVPTGDLVVTPELHEFGELAVGDSDWVVLTVANVGAGPIVVDDWEYSANDADLNVLDAGGLTVLPATFQPGDMTEVVVEYAPSASGGDEGAITIRSDDADSPVIVAQQRGSGFEDDPCDGFTQTVTLMLTADDAWEGWIDGTSFTAPNQNAWNASDTLEWEMECGNHTLALYATDVAHAVSGVIAVIWVEGAVRFVSGPSNWTMVDSPPDSTWTDVGFDDSGWNIPQVCADTSLWGSYPQPFYDQGAQWIWWTTQCRDLGEAWLRLNFTVP